MAENNKKMTEKAISEETEKKTTTTTTETSSEAESGKEQQPKSKTNDEKESHLWKQKKQPKGKVSFDETAKKKPQVRPGRVKLGTANINRDLILFAGIVGFLLLIAYCVSNIGIPTGEKRLKITDYMDLVKQKAEAQFQKHGGKTAPNCTMFLASSSIPISSHGIFAGRDYEVGDVVVRYKLLFQGVFRLFFNI